MSKNSTKTDYGRKFSDRPLNQQDLDEIAARCRSASPGPWESVEGEEFSMGGEVFFLRSSPDKGGVPDLSFATSSDFDFISHARQDIPRLLAEVLRLRKLIKEREQTPHRSLKEA